MATSWILWPDGKYLNSDHIRAIGVSGYKLTAVGLDGKAFQTYEYNTVADATAAAQAFVGQLGMTAGLVITSVSPSAAQCLVDQTITIKGSGFSSTATITVYFSGAGVYYGTATYDSPTQIHILMSELAIDPGPPAVTLLSELASDSTPSAFKVQCSDSDGNWSNWLFANEDPCFTVYPTPAA